MLIQGGSADKDHRWHKVNDVQAAITRTEAAIQRAVLEFCEDSPLSQDTLRRLRFHQRYLEDLRRSQS